MEHDGSAITEVRPRFVFLPWCPLAEEYEAGPLRLVPYRRGRMQEALAEEVGGPAAVSRILDAYRNLKGKPVHSAALIRFQDRPFVAPLDVEDARRLEDWVRIACFAGLARRSFFHGFGYCNASQFSIRFQEVVTDRGGEVTHIRHEVRRKDGPMEGGRRLDQLRFGIPEQATVSNEVRLERPLLGAFDRLRAEADNDEWSRWMDAVTCFVEANTDSQGYAGVPRRIDHVLLTSALESLFDTRGSGPNTAKAVEALVESAVGADGRVRFGDTSRYSDRLKQKYGKRASVAFAWARELYDIRNDFGHGRTKTDDADGWTLTEHDMLASMAFPVFVRVLLAELGLYTLRSDDRASLRALEATMAAPYEEWSEIQARHREAESDRMIAEGLRALRPIEYRIDHDTAE